MLKEFFDRPANPFRDKTEPSFLTIGDVLASFAVAAAVTGSAYAVVKNKDQIISYFSSENFTAASGEASGAALQQPPSQLSLE